MRSVRLLPIVILAALALLFFKGLGLVTNGGYVLTGTATVAAAGAHPDTSVDADPGMTLPSEPTMTDTSPTLDDHSPTLAARAEAADPGGAAVHGQPAGETAAPPPGTVVAVPSHGGAETADAGPPAEASALLAPSINCPPNAGRQATTQEIGDAIANATSGTPVTGPDCLGADARSDAAPVKMDSQRNLVPLTSSDGTPPTEKALLERLAERRTELEQREAELAMRQALVEAAEKRIDERTAALGALEARINALVDEKKAMEDTQFKALVGMYEGMKPADAAAIFNDIDLNVLIRLARGMNPRKMAPIMAKMLSARAQEVTVRLADSEPEPAIGTHSADLSALPQIVGH